MIYPIDFKSIQEGLVAEFELALMLRAKEIARQKKEDECFEDIKEIKRLLSKLVNNEGEKK